VRRNTKIIFKKGRFQHTDSSSSSCIIALTMVIHAHLYLVEES